MPSRRDLIKMTDDEVAAFLRGRNTMNVATHGPDGNIHLVAMWYGSLGSNPAFHTFAKSQKIQNLRRDPRITVLVETGETYDELRGVEIVGRAVVHDDPDTVISVVRDVVGRYFGIDDPGEADEVARVTAQKRVAVEIVPDKIVSWDHTKLGGTY